MVIGNTKSGKSTLINYILSNPLKSEKLNPESKGTDGKILKVVFDGEFHGP